MIQLLPLAALGAVGYLAYKKVKQEMHRVGEEVRQAEKTSAKADKISTLIQDPETGVYRPDDS